MPDLNCEIAGHQLEFIEDDHIYLVDGVMVPSVTKIVRDALGEKYANVPRAVLNRAADLGTQLHAEIEEYCRTGRAGTMPDFQGFVFLQRYYNFEVVENEVPLILFAGDRPIAAGRCDLVLRENGILGGGDIKRTASLDRHYLSCQLNLYRRAYEQSYGKRWGFLRGIWIHGSEKRKYVEIPIDDGWVDGVIGRMNYAR